MTTSSDLVTEPTSEADSPTPTPRPALAVRARNLHMDARRGHVYGPVDLDIEPGTLTVFTGRAGSGKTALLLTLTGRMRPSRGSELSVLGHQLPLAAPLVQLHTSAMGMLGLDDLDEDVTVADAVRERLAWLAPWWKIVHKPTDERIQKICTIAFGDHPVPHGTDRVYQLDEAANLLLRISLALLSNPSLIAVDELDQLHDPSERDLIYQRLSHLASTGITVLAASGSQHDFDDQTWPVTPTVIDVKRG